MADTKVTGLTEDTAPASDSLVYTVDAPGGTPVSRKTTLANLGKGLTIFGSITGLLKGSSGTISAASAGTDYENPLTFSSPLSRATNAVSLASIKDYDPIFIEWMLEGTASPEAATILTSTNKVVVRNFDDASDEDLLFYWEVPADLTGGTINFQVVTWISNATGPSNEGWAFFLQGASIGNGDILSTTLGTAVKSSITARTDSQYDRVVTALSGAVTITDLAAGETVLFKLYRDVSDADDTYAQDIGVSAVIIKYSRTLAA